MENNCNKENRCCNEECKTAFTRTSPVLSLNDNLGAVKVRLGIDRMNYRVSPGLYAVGNPESDSPVFVAANYKLSFDSLRKELTSITAWVLVLDTKGINVWCAAGKGTFSTGELINRIWAVNLSSVVAHKTLILPQLGAAGVAAHEVKAATGFTVIYGPIRSSDIPRFMKSKMQADKKMRTVQFNLWDRIILTPVEIVQAVPKTLISLGIVFLLNLIGVTRFTGMDVVAYIGAVLIGCVIVPILLPLIPVRAFSLKGWFAGILWAVLMIMAGGIWPVNGAGSLFTGIAYLLIFPSISAMYALGFTGCTPFTSHSGVQKEVKLALPIIACTVAIGAILMILNTWVGGGR